MYENMWEHQTHHKGTAIWLGLCLQKHVAGFAHQLAFSALLSHWVLKLVFSQQQLDTPSVYSKSILRRTLRTLNAPGATSSGQVLPRAAELW